MKMPESPVDFSLTLQVWKGKTIVRTSPSRIIYRILFDMPEDKTHPITSFALNDNPIEVEETTATRVPCSDKDALQRGKPNEDRSYLEPKQNSFWNDTKATPTSVRLLTNGTATFFIINGLWKFVLQSKQLKGLFTLTQQDSTDLWTWKRSAGPGEKASSPD